MWYNWSNFFYRTFCLSQNNQHLSQISLIYLLHNVGTIRKSHWLESFLYERTLLFIQIVGQLLIVKHLE